MENENEDIDNIKRKRRLCVRPGFMQPVGCVQDGSVEGG